MTSFDVYMDAPKCVPDKATLRRAVAGDPHAVAFVCGSVRSYVATIVRGELGTWARTEEIEEAIIDCMEKIVRGLHTYDVSRPFKPWMGMVVRNKTRTLAKSRWAKDAQSHTVFTDHFSKDDCASGSLEDLLSGTIGGRSGNPTARDIAEQREYRALLLEAVESLPDEMARVVYAVMEHDTQSAAAESLSMPYHRLRAIYDESVARLRKQLSFIATEAGRPPGPGSQRNTARTAARKRRRSSFSAPSAGPSAPRRTTGEIPHFL